MNDIKIMDFAPHELKLRLGNEVLGLFKSRDYILVIYKSLTGHIETTKVLENGKQENNCQSGCDVILKSKDKTNTALFLYIENNTNISLFTSAKTQKDAHLWCERNGYKLYKWPVNTEFSFEVDDE